MRIPSNVFGRSYDHRHGAVQYFTVRTAEGYAVLRRSANDYLGGPALVSMFEYRNYPHAAACRAAANDYARLRARQEEP